jgi:hypothetical protein
MIVSTCFAAEKLGMNAAPEGVKLAQASWTLNLGLREDLTIPSHGAWIFAGRCEDAPRVQSIIWEA